MTREEVVALMESCTSEKEWNACCNFVREKCGGKYPPFWGEAILTSDLYAQVFARWSKNPKRTLQ